jgi:formylglycine-generating enzyme required for sulfatase activity
MYWAPSTRAFGRKHGTYPDEPLLGFVRIPEGRFLMGSDKASDPDANDDELPQHTVVLPEYFIARYPVTVAQFRAFVEDTGHQPEEADSLRGVPNHPVVSVSWYEAVEYGDWLTARLREWRGITGAVGEPVV